MSESTSETQVAETHEHAGPNFVLYMQIFGALCVFTLASFLAYTLLGQGVSSMVIMMLISICKAYLVIMFFMHLKYDWGKLYFLVLPVVLMGIMLVIVLLPDMVFAWHTSP